MAAKDDVQRERMLIEKARSGNAAAFTALMKEYRDQVYRIALKITNNHEDAKDVLQDSLLKAYQRLATFRGDSRFSTWLVSIVVRQSLSKVRGRISRREISLDNPIQGPGDHKVARSVADVGDDPEAQYLKSELQKIMFEAIDHLEPDLRVVLVMRDLGLLSLEEMAEALEVSLPVAKSRLFRARNKLRQLFLLRLDGRGLRKRIQEAYSSA